MHCFKLNEGNRSASHKHLKPENKVFVCLYFLHPRRHLSKPSVTSLSLFLLHHRALLNLSLTSALLFYSLPHSFARSLSPSCHALPVPLSYPDPLAVLA